ncbi:hypothetical protein GH5_04187 [Leishmania sp. Ghana 2012 LV757]|uniref:hypothetical protein n=1 Tax=Leishmania sp. Ghana 2012 LV757 TaxID=2803181 RepID=UPI001B4A8E60|nr:hypothetical protein GH5_04187 [Leishmania sp. Ghana 2012 LV757]
MGAIRRSEGNVLVICASLTIGFIIVGTCVFVWLCRSRRIPPHRYGHVRRLTTPSLYTLSDCTLWNESDRGSPSFTFPPAPAPTHAT